MYLCPHVTEVVTFAAKIGEAHSASSTSASVSKCFYILTSLMGSQVGDRWGWKDFSNCSCSQELEGLEVERVEMIRQHLCQYNTLRHETDMFNQSVSTRLSLNKNTLLIFMYF